MGSIKYLLYLFAFSLLVSCALLQRGYYNEYDQYLPKKDCYKLKDKADLQIPYDLDLLNIYSLKEKYYRGKQYYPIDPFAEDPKFNPMHNIEQFIRFTENGRCYSFSKKKFDEYNNLIPLEESHLSTKNAHYLKEYYYQHSFGIQIESFVPKEGSGEYLYKYCKILENGNKMKLSYDLSDPTSYDIYELVVLPNQYDRPVIDW